MLPSKVKWREQLSYAASGKPLVPNDSVLCGVAHGKTIELETDAALPEGKNVLVVLRPVDRTSQAGEGLKQSFGGWGEEVEELDAYLAWSRQQRKTSRKGREPGASCATPISVPPT